MCMVDEIICPWAGFKSKVQKLGFPDGRTSWRNNLHEDVQCAVVQSYLDLFYAVMALGKEAVPESDL